MSLVLLVLPAFIWFRIERHVGEVARNAVST